MGLRQIDYWPLRHVQEFNLYLRRQLLNTLDWAYANAETRSQRIRISRRATAADMGRYPSKDYGYENACPQRERLGVEKMWQAASTYGVTPEQFARIVGCVYDPREEV